LFLLIFKSNAEVEKDGSILIIDNKEKLIKPVSVNYHEWARILGEVCRLINKVFLDNTVIVELKWKGQDGSYLFSRSSQREQGRILEIGIISGTTREQLVKYTVVPWQNFTRDFIIRDLSNEENSKYETMLERWLLGFKTVYKKPGRKAFFPGYTPKLTQDSAKDFMPLIGEKIDNIPAALISNLPDLLDLFIKYRKYAEENPGHWENGNMILGAREKEYIPSEDEILLSETGNRIRKIINPESKKEIKRLLKGKHGELRELKYTMFTFTHADVMGSGRFFYVDTIKKVKIDLQR